MEDDKKDDEEKYYKELLKPIPEHIKIDSSAPEDGDDDPRDYLFITTSPDAVRRIREGLARKKEREDQKKAEAEAKATPSVGSDDEVLNR